MLTCKIYSIALTIVTKYCGVVGMEMYFKLLEEENILVRCCRVVNIL